MPQFFVSDDLAAVIWKLANPRPFEDLSFETALRRVITSFTSGKARGGKRQIDADNLVEELDAYIPEYRRARTPSAMQWAASINELKGVPNLNSWQSICDHLEIKTGRDSARRKLQKWVKDNRPLWPSVPDTDS